MEADASRSNIHESPSIESVKIPEDVREALESLPERNSGRMMVLPPWVDLVLTKYWRTKRKADIATKLGISQGVLRRRAEELGL